MATKCKQMMKVALLALVLTTVKTQAVRAQTVSIGTFSLHGPQDGE